jgi:hypothetical protein
MEQRNSVYVALWCILRCEGRLSVVRQVLPHVVVCSAQGKGGFSKECALCLQLMQPGLRVSNSVVLSARTEVDWPGILVGQCFCTPVTQDQVAAALQCVVELMEFGLVCHAGVLQVRNAGPVPDDPLHQPLAVAPLHHHGQAGQR